MQAIMHLYLKQPQNLFDSEAQILNSQASKPRGNKQTPLRDFTLTNVRHNAKLIDIKSAIEKLKGYKIECQNLILVDEQEVFSEGYSQNIILQPIKQNLLQQKNRLVNGKPILQVSSNELHQVALEEAKQNYLRLRDDYTVAAYDILQEYPYTFEWRQAQMEKINHVLNQSRVSNASEHQASVQNTQKNYFLVLDLCFPMILVEISRTFTQTEPTQGCYFEPIQLTLSKYTSIYAIKCLIRKHLEVFNHEAIIANQIQIFSHERKLDKMNLLLSDLGYIDEVKTWFQYEILPHHLVTGPSQIQSNLQQNYDLGGSRNLKNQIPNFVIDSSVQKGGYPKFNLNLNIDQIEKQTGKQQENPGQIVSTNPPVLSPQISLGIDFTFNTIKNVQKINWKNECPWYREIKDGFSWFCYCLNTKCEAYKKLVVLSRGYAHVSLLRELSSAVCPVCKEGNRLTETTGLL